MVRLAVCGLVAFMTLAACGTSSAPAGEGQWAAAAPPPGDGSAPRPSGAPVPLTAERVEAVLRDIVAGEPAAVGPRTTKERQQLDALYANTPAAVWLDAVGRPTTDAEDAIALLSTADAQGLRSADYQPALLARLAHRLDTAGESGDPVARFDILLSLHVMRYWRELHMGRVDPRAIGFRLSAPIDDHDFPAMLRAAVAAHRIGAATDELAPPLVLYRSLVTALSRYRAIEPQSRPVTVPLPPRSYKPGADVQGLASLHARLVLLGDLPEGTPSPADAYEGAIVAGIKRFQNRHGLIPDGVLGRATLAALAVPLATRVEQLELALERLRWLPHLDEAGLVAVNIPMFRLWAWERAPSDGTPLFDLGVIVGRALDTQTPVFAESMEYVIFRPYWNVPPSILRGEVLPAIARDASYLARNDMEIVAGAGDDARVVPPSDDALAALRQGRLRVRQRPGAKNSLGLVKFVFPNDEDIYMHGTPAQYLFGRARRDFSHGCVRLEDPVQMAEWVLRDQPEWTRERILNAMEEGPISQRVHLTRPLQVILFYVTAMVRLDDGTVQFADDIYGHDGRLARALAEKVRSEREK
jgi:murein L,D-transpeptidase YcbB/YkuD